MSAEDVEALTARLDAAHEHLAYHLRDFRPGGDMKLTGDLAVDMASYAGRLKSRADTLAARLAKVESIAERLIDELIECRSFITVETRHYPTATAISEVIEHARADLGSDQ